MFFKKRTLMFTLGFVLIILSSGMIATTNELGKNTNLLPNLKLRINNGEVLIGSFDDIRTFNEKSNNNAQVNKISLINDIDLTNATLKDLNDLDEMVSEKVGEIDGNGYSIKNKPVEYFSVPLFGSVSNEVDGNHKLYIHNITFDNAPLAFSTIQSNPAFDLVSSVSEDGTNHVIDQDRTIVGDTSSPINSIYLQNISVINTSIESQTFTLPETKNIYSGLFSKKVNANVTGSPTRYDSVIHFNGINISNNKINNNVFIGSSAIKTINFGLLSNLKYFTCMNNNGDNHINLISFKNIVIEDNEILGNKITLLNDDVVMSFSPLISSFELNSSENQIGDGNFLEFDSILIQNNLFEKPNGILDENFKYSDLISQSLDISVTSKLCTDIEVLQNIISLNNNIYLNYEDKKYYENPTIITIENVGLSYWSKADSNKLFFIGNSYKVDLMLDLSVNLLDDVKFNQIYHATRLNRFDNEDDWNKMLELLKNNFGIYGASLELDERGNLEKIEVINNYENNNRINIIENKLFVNQNNVIVGTKMNFDLILQRKNNMDDESNLINNPLTIENVRILSNGKVIGTANEDSYGAVNIDEMNYSFDVDITFNEAIDESNINNYNNIQLAFNYTNETTKFLRNTTINLDVQELIDNSVISKIETPETIPPSLSIKSWIIGITIVLSIFIIIIILISILFLITRHYKKAKIKNEFDDSSNSFEDWAN